ncbi:hypothetical protein QLR68_26405, partial [Micromonospora sp. DH15]|nr:hypothetical protein [Micromonospora sp. DH15]
MSRVCRAGPLPDTPARAAPASAPPGEPGLTSQRTTPPRRFTGPVRCGGDLGGRCRPPRSPAQPGQRVRRPVGD